MKKYFTIKDVTSPLNDLRQKGHTKGVSCGLPVLDDIFTIKKRYPLFVAGAPYSGKTEFVLEILVNLSLDQNWKHFIYVGEGGDVENVFAELVSKHMGKQYHKGEFGASDTDVIDSSQFIEKHFVIANHDLEFTIDDFYKAVEEAEKELGIKFDTTVFDPFNDIKDQTEEYGGREDKYLASALKKVRVSSKKNNRVDVLVNHIADVRAKDDKDTGMRYMPAAMPNEWAGGRTWWRRAFTMLLIYRPPVFLKNEHGVNYEPNETLVFVQKSKPKGVGKNGVASIFYDWKKNRYYCMFNGQLLFSCEKPELFKSTIEPNRNFYEVDKEVI